MGSRVGRIFRTARAASRPCAIAPTTVDGPTRASPATQTRSSYEVGAAANPPAAWRRQRVCHEVARKKESGLVDLFRRRTHQPARVGEAATASPTSRLNAWLPT